jgi:hypothetical protein
MEVAEDQIAELFASMAQLLDERQRRMTAGAAARMFGRGGTTTVARVAHMSRNTVLTGAREIEAGDAAAPGRVRREGGGRRRSIDKDPNLLLELDDLVSPEAQGDPMSPLRWTAKSTYQLADTLHRLGGATIVHLQGALLVLVDVLCEDSHSPRAGGLLRGREHPRFRGGTNFRG